MSMYTLLDLKWTTNKDLLYSKGNSVHCYLAAWMQGEFGENEYMYMYGWIPLLSTLTYHNTLNQLYFNIKLNVFLVIVFTLFFPQIYISYCILLPHWLPRWLRGKESTCQCSRHRFSLWAGKIPWRRAWWSTSVFLPGEPHGQRSLAGYSSWGRIDSDMTEYAGAHCLTTSLASIIMVTVDISNWFQTLIEIAVMIWF